MKPPVAVKITPDIGGPAMPPKPMRDMNIPTRRPASSILPIATAGAEYRDIYAPMENLDGSVDCAPGREKVQYIPVNDGYCNKLGFVFSKRPGDCRDSCNSRVNYHGVECACQISTDVRIVHSCQDLPILSPNSPDDRRPNADAALAIAII